MNTGFKIFSGYWTNGCPVTGAITRIPYTPIDWIDDAIHEIERYTFHGRRSCLRLLVFSPVTILIMIYTLLRVTIFWKRHYA